MDGCEIPRWQILKSHLKNLSPKEFRKGLREIPRPVLLDVRTLEEVNNQALAKSIHLDYLGPDFLDKLEVMDRDLTYFIYCRTGRRSVRAGILMHNWGFNHLVNLEGGLAAWERELGRVISS